MFQKVCCTISLKYKRVTTHMCVLLTWPLRCPASLSHSRLMTENPECQTSQLSWRSNTLASVSVNTSMTAEAWNVARQNVTSMIHLYFLILLLDDLSKANTHKAHPYCPGALYIWRIIGRIVRRGNWAVPRRNWPPTTYRVGQCTLNIHIEHIM